MNRPLASPLYPLDTNLLVAYARNSPLGSWIEAAYGLTRTPTIPLISAVTNGELLSFSRYNRWGGPKQQAAARLLRRFLIVPLDYPGLMDAYADIDVFRLRSGIRMGKNDLWIDAAANVTGARLLTTDHDFDYLDNVFLTRDWINPQNAATP